MKKLAILTSILALAACGGGSGGGAPGAIVMPTDNVALVAKDSGLTMVDINATRAANYKQALETVRSIEAGHDITGAVTVSRASVTQRQSINMAKLSDYTTDDLDSAYQAMHDILVGGILDNRTNHDVLFALALSGMTESDIINLLKSVNDGNVNLVENIRRFVEILSEDEKTDEIDKIIERATYVYKDFGKEFKTTLENAKFRGNFSGGYFTFVFDENGDIDSMKQIDGAEETFATIGGGRFQQQKKGTEYRCEVLMDEQGNSIDASVFFATNERPNEAEIKERLIGCLVRTCAK